MSITVTPERPLAVAKLATRWVLTALLLWLATTPPEVRSACPSTCDCRWKGGKDTTECVDKGLTAIPPGIDTATQVLDMTSNGLHSLPKEVFLRNGLTNLQKIFLINCKLALIDPLAFSRLKNLVELDLSNNLLAGVPSDSFRGLGELRRLVLSGNPMGTVAAKAFAPLGSLIVLEMSNCQLETVEGGAFGGLPGLQQLKLNGNRLRALATEVLKDIGSLHGIRLEENPWHCDCHCRDFRFWLTASNVPRTVAPQCGEPPRLRGFDVDKLVPEDFACAPYGLGPQAPGALRAPLGGNVSLQCDVTSDPEAFVHWLWQGTVITNTTGPVDSEDGGRTYLVEESSGSSRKSSVLTLEALEERDAGLYVCVAENRGGRHLVNFTLRVEVPAGAGGTGVPPEVSSKGVLLGAIIGLGVFALAALVLVVVLVARCCHAHHRRRRHRRHKIPRSETQETKGSSCTYDSQNDPLNEKRDLQPAPNPIQKPPRSFAANATYVSTSEISLHDYGGSHQSSERLMGGGIGGAGGVPEPHNGSVYSIRPDIIKMDNGEYSVPRGALVSPVSNGGAAVADSSAIYQNTGRWSSESPIATCHGCGDHAGSCLGVPCLQPYGHGPEADAESDRSYRAANFRPTASGLAGALSAYDAEEEWPRPPPPLYDTVKQPMAVQGTWDGQYEPVPYPVSGGSGSGQGPVWERQSPVAAAGGATVADSFPGSSRQLVAGAAPKHPNVHLKNSVSGLSPFPILNLSTVRDSPDEGYEDEGEEGTEV